MIRVLWRLRGAAAVAYVCVREGGRERKEVMIQHRERGAMARSKCQ